MWYSSLALLARGVNVDCLSPYIVTAGIGLYGERPCNLPLQWDKQNKMDGWIQSENCYSIILDIISSDTIVIRTL